MLIIIINPGSSTLGPYKSPGDVATGGDPKSISISVIIIGVIIGVSSICLGRSKELYSISDSSCRVQ